jgi:PAS domain S-box-containing protein
VAERKYDQPVKLGTDDELGHLGRAFDTMMASVASQVGELQRDQQLLEAAPDAMVVIDKTGVIKIVNGASERLFGYTRAELLGQNVDVLVPDAVRGTHAGHRDLYVQKPAPRSMGTGRNLLGKRKEPGRDYPAGPIAALTPASPASACGEPAQLTVIGSGRGPGWRGRW